MVTISQSMQRVYNGAGCFGQDHKDLHSSVSKIGKTIDRVHIYYQLFIANVIVDVIFEINVIYT